MLEKVMEDAKLSWKAKGLFAFIFKNGGATRDEIIKNSKGTEHFRDAIRELIVANYITSLGSESRRKKVKYTICEKEDD